MARSALQRSHRKNIICRWCQCFWTLFVKPLNDILIAEPLILDISLVPAVAEPYHRRECYLYRWVKPRLYTVGRLFAIPATMAR